MSSAGRKQASGHPQLLSLMTPRRVFFRLLEAYLSKIEAGLKQLGFIRTAYRAARSSQRAGWRATMVLSIQSKIPYLSRASCS